MPFGVENVDLWGFPMVKKLRIDIIILTEYWQVMGGQTDIFATA